LFYDNIIEQGMITFGPVPSRRLGKSLGINNIISPKTCTYDCIYCQVGKTINKSCRRKSFYKPQVIYEKVVKHLNSLRKENYPDYLTFVANGEPTLDKNLDKTIRLLKATGIPVAVISNASLLFNDGVKEALDLADWVSLKMDAGDPDIWNSVNRPADRLDFERTLSSIVAFSDRFKGKLTTETMVVNGINDTTGNISALAEKISEVKPGVAYLAVPTRPPVERSVKPPEAEKLNLAWQIFNNKQIKTEFLVGFEGTDTGYTGNIYEDILNITAVHPLREDSLLKLLQNDFADYAVVDSLIRQRLIRPVIYEGHKYFIRDYHQVV
jgi:wyosine [tRNA(Phe)-imidazoG37] synthetase (radical SAM superfamily)